MSTKRAGPSSSGYERQLDLLYSIVLNDVERYKSIRMYGVNLGLPEGEWADVWDGPGAYQYPDDLGEEMFVLSDNIEDKGGGNGAQGVSIRALDENGLINRSSYELCGLVPVDTDKYSRVISIEVTGPSSNIGTIYLGNGALVGGVPENIYAIILPGINRSRTTHITVPSNMEALLTSWKASVNSVTATTIDLELQCRKRDSVFKVCDSDTIVLGKTDGGKFNLSFIPSEYLEPFMDVRIMAYSSGVHQGKIIASLSAFGRDLINVDSSNPAPREF